MKRHAVTILLLSLLSSLGVWAQGQEHANASVPRKLVTVYGKVGADGRTLIAAKDQKWTASDDALKGHEGQQVSIRCRVTGEHSMQVLAVRERPDLSKYSVNLGDAAFRR